MLKFQIFLETFLKLISVYFYIGSGYRTSASSQKLRLKSRQYHVTTFIYMSVCDPSNSTINRVGVVTLKM